MILSIRNNFSDFRKNMWQMPGEDSFSYEIDPNRLVIGTASKDRMTEVPAEIATELDKFYAQYGAYSPDNLQLDRDKWLFALRKSGIGAHTSTSFIWVESPGLIEFQPQLIDAIGYTVLGSGLATRFHDATLNDLQAMAS